MSTYDLDETIEELLGEPIKGYQLNAMFVCPLHDEDSPSFSIRRDDGRWQCFGCGAKGGIERLARLLGETLDDETRQDILIRSVSLNENPPARRNFAPVANGYIQALQTKRGQSLLRDYLERRRLPDSVAVAFGLGYDESRDCLALPYWDQGTVTGIKFRSRDSHKYSLDGSTYGLYNVDELRGRPIVVVGEGESDTHTLWAGLTGERQPATGHDTHERQDQGLATIGVGGTSGALKSERLWQLFALDLLFARKVYVCYDADEAGDQAYEYAAKALGSKAIRVRPTKGNDITEHILAGGTLEEIGLDKATLDL